MQRPVVRNSMQLSKRKPVFWLALPVAMALGVAALPQLCGQDRAAEERPQFVETVQIVTAPVTVIDRDGNYVDGLQPHQFRLFDNGKEQDIRVDVTFQPISLVILVQANNDVEQVLPHINKIGPLIEPLVIGEQGEAAVIAFDHRIREVQGFTSDPEKISKALREITPGSTSSRMVDAVTQGVRMLRGRAPNRRRVMLLISETRDKASEGRVREALIAAQLANVNIYSVNISRVITTLTNKPLPPRPDPLPPAMRPLPPNVPATPTSVAAKTGGPGGQVQFLPVLLEIYKDVKAIFVDNPIEVFTKGTGGTEFSFVRQKALEEAIGRIGRELHSQYLVSYSPNNKDEGGFHEIQV
ncbi:MAG: VWA domain-containing protein, partial [Acidobacteria bacterium]|nr:VWA domain-containing protein [Acidobacteriota bacterium]